VCPNEPKFTQCVDYKMVSHEDLKPYYFFTMLISFGLPFICLIICYSLVIYEIGNMQLKDKSKGRP